MQGICGWEEEMRRSFAVLRCWRPQGWHFSVARLRPFAALLVTATLLLSVGPNPFNTAPVRGDDVVYDFVANAASASWSSGAGALPFPGSDSDSRGFALLRSGFTLEDGSSPSKSLQTHPQWVSNGWIQGRYPTITVPDGAELHLKVGFYNGATGTDGVVFQVQFEEGQTRSTLLGVGATYEGKLDVATKDLSSLAGKTGHFILYVNAANSSGQDWAAWAEARVVAEELELPDLRVKRIETGPGGKLQVTVRNYGDAALPQGWSAVASVSFDASPKGVFDLRTPTSISDGGIGEPGGSSVYLLAWSITGVVTVEVCADSTDSIAEEDEDNNCRSEGLESAAGARPDLVVAEVLCDWDNHRIGYVLKNVGDVEAPAGHVTELIVESSPAASQSEAGELAPGATLEGWFEEYSWDVCEALKVTVCADNRNDVAEADEDNNCLTRTCECTPQPPPTVCPPECECLEKYEGYARGLEYCLDGNGAPIVCDVIDAEKEIYRYCFSAGAEAAAKAGSEPPLPQDSDVDGDGEIGVDDVAAIAAHYGGRTGTSRVPWDPNEDGVVDFKDLAIIGSRFGRSIAELTLEEHGISTPGDLLESVGSVAAFTDLSFRTGIDPERLLRQIGRAELESAVPGLPDCHLDRLEALGMGSLAALQAVAIADESVRRMLCDEMRLDWIASGGKERGEPLPSPDDLDDWIGAAQGKAPAFGKTDDGAIRFADGSMLPSDEEEDVGDGVMPAMAPDAVSGPPVPRSSLVFTGRYPGIAGGVLAEEAGPGIPREPVPEPCPVIDGRIYGFPYDVSTLKIQAERFELRMTYDPLTRQPQGARRVAVDGRLIDVEQRFAGLSGGRLTYYNSGCLSPGEWTLTPVFHSDEPETPVWHGDWSPYYREEVVTSGLEPVTDADFTFLPVETEPPTIELAHSPVQPGGTDVITFNVSIEDDHMIQKVEIYEWGRYTDGRQTEPERIASYFWDSGYPRERSYRAAGGCESAPPGWLPARAQLPPRARALSGGRAERDLFRGGCVGLPGQPRGRR